MIWAFYRKAFYRKVLFRRIMSTQKNTKDSIVFFIIGAIKPFKWLIVGQFIVTVI